MTDPHGHLDLDALADVLAGERDDPHLRSCAECRGRLADLRAADARVTAALGALPPPPLPDGLAARLDRALQHERRGEVAAVRTLPRRPRRAPAWLPAVAASAALVMAGAVGWSLLDGAGSSSVDTASSAGGGSGQESTDDSAAAPETSTALVAPRTGTATDWAVEAARPAALASLLRTAELADAADAAAGAQAAPAPAAPTAAAPTAAAPTAAAPTGDALDRLRDPAELAACLADLPAGDDDVLAVDYAQWAGSPAVTVVQAIDDALVRITVVGSGCSATDPDLLGGTVLPRP